ncbi:hypothetical protein BJ741DRAFT_611438 [Chytriomyces cf. hyalinus JEL632]|nr:hypothetical protein BJ741DRAFT_611438 [Chytriomyces cf. hyalinus JEL632]
MHSLRSGFATPSRRCLSSWPFSQTLQGTPDRTSNPISDRLDEPGTVGRHSDAKIALAENGPLFNKLRNQFESKLLHKGDADIAWSDYSRLLDSMLDKVSVSIVSHHFLFKSICSTPTTQSTDLESKTHLLNKIVLQLGRDARMDEYERLASLYERQNNLAGIRALVNRVRSSAALPGSAISATTPHISISNSLIKVSLAHGDSAAALAVFETLQLPDTKKVASPNTKTYNLILRHYLDTHAFGPMTSLLQSMIQSHVPQNSLTFDLQMLALFRQSKWQQVITAYREMTSLHLKPSINSYKTALRAAEKSEDFESLVSVHREFLDAASIEPGVSQQLDRANVTHRVLAQISRDAKYMDTVLALFQEMKQQHVATAYTYQLVATAYCRFSSSNSTYLTAAVGLMDEMVAKGMAPALTMYTAVAYTISKQCLDGSAQMDASQVQQLKRIYFGMRDNCKTSPAWTLMEMIATVLIRAEEYSAARDVLKDAITVDALRVWALLDAFTGATIANSKASVNDAGLLVRLAVESLLARASEGNDLVGRINQIAADACFAALISASGTGEEADAVFQDFKRVFEIVQTLNGKSVRESVVVDGMLLRCSGSADQTFAFLDSLDSLKWKVSVRGLISVAVKMQNRELEALVDKLKNAGWKHRRVLVIVKTVADSIDGVETRVPGVRDASWIDSGMTEEEVHRMHDFAIGAGRGVVLN